MTESVLIGPYRVRRNEGARSPSCEWLLEIPKSIAGRRMRRFFAHREEAIEKANALIRGVGQELFAAQRSDQRLSTISLYEAVDQWLTEQERRVALRKKAPKSLDRDRWNVKAIKSFFRNVRLDAITEQRLEDFQIWRLRKQGRSPDTVNGDIAILCGILRWAHRNQFLARVPRIDPVPSDVGRNLHVPTQAEVVRIIGALPRHNRTVVQFIAETGCRSGEAFNLTWENVDLENGIVQIRANEKWSPKTRHSTRRLAISPSVKAQLSALPSRGQYVFASPKDANKRRDNIRKSLLTAVKKANVVRDGKPLRVTLHTLRKAYATWAATEAEMPFRQLQDQLGHAPGSKMTLKHYVGRSRDLLQQCVMPLPVVSQDREVATKVATR